MYIFIRMSPCFLFLLSSSSSPSSSLSHHLCRFLVAALVVGLLLDDPFLAFTLGLPWRFPLKGASLSSLSLLLLLLLLSSEWLTSSSWLSTLASPSWCSSSLPSSSSCCIFCVCFGGAAFFCFAGGARWIFVDFTLLEVR